MNECQDDIYLVYTHDCHCIHKKRLDHMFAKAKRGEKSNRTDVEQWFTAAQKAVFSTFPE